MKFTLSIYKMFHVLDFVDEVIKPEIFKENNPSELTISLVEGPRRQSLQALPIDVKEIVKEKYALYQNSDFGRASSDLDIAVKYMLGAG